MMNLSEKHQIKNTQILLSKDIKATHIAIEAPIQALLKLSMIGMGLLEIPGKTIFEHVMIITYVLIYKILDPLTSVPSHCSI